MLGLEALGRLSVGQISTIEYMAGASLTVVAPVVGRLPTPLGANLIAPATWTPTAATVTGSGTLTLAEDGATSWHWAKQTTSLPAGSYSFSIEFKSVGSNPRGFSPWLGGLTGSDFIGIEIRADGTVLYGPPTAGYVGGGFTSNRVVVDPVGDGFWKVEFYFSTTGINSIDLYLIEPTAAPDVYTYPGLNNGSGVQFRNAALRQVQIPVTLDLDFENGNYSHTPESQLSVSRGTSGYAQTKAGVLVQFASTQLRITDLGLLIEDARTNYIPDSNTFQGGTWLTQNIAFPPGATGPDPLGNTTVYQAGATSTSGPHRVYINPTAPVTAPNVTSIYAKMGVTGQLYFALGVLGSSETVYQTCVFNLSTGALVSTNGANIVALPAEQLANGYWRFAVSRADKSVTQIYFTTCNLATPTYNAIGTPTGYSGVGYSSGAYAWGPQCEKGTWPSSYISTAGGLGGPVTRAQEVVSITFGGISNLLMTIPYSVVVDCKAKFTPNNTWRVLGTNTVDTLLYSQSSDNTLSSYNSVAGGFNATIGSIQTFSGGVRVGASAGAAGRKLVGGGGPVETGGSPQAQPNAILGSGYNSTAYTFWGYIRRFTIWDKQLSDLELLAVTAPAAAWPDYPALTTFLLITPVSLIVSSPTFGTPTLVVLADNLTASNLAATAPSFGTPAMQPIILLAASNLATGPPVEAAAPIGQKHVLAATALASSALTLGTPSISQRHALTALGIAVQPYTLGAPALGQKHVLVPYPFTVQIAAGAIGTGSLGQRHSFAAPITFVTPSPYREVRPVVTLTELADTLSAVSASAGAPVLGQPAFKQVHALAGSSFVDGLPVFAQPAIGQRHALVATGYVDTAPVFSAAALGVIVNATAGNLVVASPTIGAPAMVGVAKLVAANFASSAPSSGVPAIGVIVTCVAVPLAVGAPAISVPALGAIANLTATALATTVPAIGTPVMGVIGKPTAADLATSAPVIGAPAMGVIVACTALPLVDSPPVTPAATMTVIVKLTAVNLTPQVPTLGAPAIKAISNLIAVNLVVTAPTIGAPAMVTIVALTATPLVVSVPAVAPASFKQVHAFTTALLPVPPVLGQPAFGQKHVLAAASFTTIPFVYSPVVLGQAGIMSAIPVAISLIVLGTPALGQRHALTAAWLPVPPVLGQPALGKVLSAASFAVGSPLAFGTPALSLSLAAAKLDVGAPVLGAPALGKIFAAAGAAAGAPVLGAPAFGQRHELGTVSAQSGTPVIGVASFGQAGIMAALPLAAGAPVLDAPLLGQRHALAAVSLTTGVPVLTTADIAQKHALATPSFATSAPSFGSPALGQKHVFTAVSLAPAPVIGIGIMGAAGELTAIPATAGVPVLGVPAFGQKHLTVAQSLAAGAPALGVPALGKVLSAAAFTVSAPVLGAPTLGKVLAAASFATGTPAIGEPICALRVFGLTASNLVIGSPVLPALTLALSGVVSTVPLAAGAPVFGAPAFKQRHLLAAAGVSVAPPDLAAPALAVRAGLIARDLAAGAPIFGGAGLNQVHKLTPVSVQTVPVLDAGFMGQAGVMAALPLWLQSPTVPVLVLHQCHRFTTNGVTVSPPWLEAPEYQGRVRLPEPWDVFAGRFKPLPAVLGQEHRLNAQAASAGRPVVPVARFFEEETFPAVPLEVSPPVLGAPDLAAVSRFTAIGLAPRPALGAPELGQEHHLGARDLSAGRPALGRPELSELRDLSDPIGIEVEPPVLGTPACGQHRRVLSIGHITSRQRLNPIVGQRAGSAVTGRRAGNGGIIGQRDSQVGIVGRRAKS